MNGESRVYLDHAATTPPAPEVVEAMLPYLGEVWHNPSSIYVEAQHAHQAIDEARATVAAWIGAQPEEIIFTSGGSESDNLALRGVLAASRARGQHMITNGAEHHAVLDTAEQLEREGAEVTLVDVGPDGRIDPRRRRRRGARRHRARLDHARQQRGRRPERHRGHQPRGPRAQPAHRGPHRRRAVGGAHERQRRPPRRGPADADGAQVLRGRGARGCSTSAPARHSPR